MPQALPNPAGPIFQLTPEQLVEGYRLSRESPRLRIIQPVQRSQSAHVQRLINFMQPGTYVQPHCHPQPHATESICLISGALEVIIFSEEGKILSRHLLTREAPLIDIEPQVWHGIVPQLPDTAVFEVKKGPYDPETDKRFAAWAPEEGDSESVTAFLSCL